MRDLDGRAAGKRVAREVAAKHLGMKPEDVIVRVTLPGGAFGRWMPELRRGSGACCRKQWSGKPVKVTWTREDDIRHDYYHTVSLEHLEGSSMRTASPMPGFTAVPRCRSGRRVSPKSKEQGGGEAAQSALAPLPDSRLSDGNGGGAGALPHRLVTSAQMSRMPSRRKASLRSWPPRRTAITGTYTY